MADATQDVPVHAGSNVEDVSEVPYLDMVESAQARGFKNGREQAAFVSGWLIGLTWKASVVRYTHVRVGPDALGAVTALLIRQGFTMELWAQGADGGCTMKITA